MNKIELLYRILHYTHIAIFICMISKNVLIFIDNKAPNLQLKIIATILIFGIIWLVVVCVVNFIFELMIKKTLNNKGIELSEWTCVAMAYGMLVVIWLIMVLLIDPSKLMAWIF